MMNDQLWLFILSQVVTAGGIYSAIRADLASLKARVDHAEKDIERLHKVTQ